MFWVFLFVLIKIQLQHFPPFLFLPPTLPMTSLYISSKIHGLFFDTDTYIIYTYTTHTRNTHKYNLLSLLSVTCIIWFLGWPLGNRQPIRGSYSWEEEFSQHSLVDWSSLPRSRAPRDFRDHERKPQSVNLQNNWYWAAHPQWIHLQYNSCTRLRNIAEERAESPSRRAEDSLWDTGDTSAIGLLTKTRTGTTPADVYHVLNLLLSRQLS